MLFQSLTGNFQKLKPQFFIKGKAHTQSLNISAENLLSKTSKKYLLAERFLSYIICLLYNAILRKNQMSDVFGLPDKLREVVLKFNEQNALDEMILAPATYKNKLTLQGHVTVFTDTNKRSQPKQILNPGSQILLSWP